MEQLVEIFHEFEIVESINSFTTELPIIQKTVHWVVLQISRLVYTRVGPPP